MSNLQCAQNAMYSLKAWLTALQALQRVQEEHYSSRLHGSPASMTADKYKCLRRYLKILAGAFTRHNVKFFLPDMVEAAADSKGAFADGGVFETGAKFAAGKAAHATRIALGTEPCGGVGRGTGKADAAGMERSQTGPATCHQACHAQPPLGPMLDVAWKVHGIVEDWI